MKFGGNTSYGSRMIHKKIENFWLNWSVFSKNGQNLKKILKIMQTINHIDRIFKKKIFLVNLTQL
jgi:hypothetical protein